MVRNFFKIAVALSAYVACAVSPLYAQDEERSLSLDQTRVYHSGQARPGTLTLEALLDHPDATYGIGEVLRMAVRTNEDAYVTVFNVGTSGKVTQLFPNGYQANNRIRAGQVLEVPSASSDSRIKVGGPAGVELIKIIATSRPVNIVPDAHFQSAGGQLKVLTDGADGLDRDLQVVSANQADDLKIAIIHQLIRTVPPRTGFSGGTTLVVPTYGVLTTTSTVSDNSQRFPLLLAVDKTSYRAGEAITMAITPLKPCYLTVIGTDNSGHTRRIFPSTLLPTQQIAGMQTLMLSGGSSPQTIVAGRPGKEVVKAVCTTEPRIGTLSVRSATEDLSGEEKEATERDLTVVANRPTAPVGYAEIDFGITR